MIKVAEKIYFNVYFVILNYVCDILEKFYCKLNQN